MQKFTHLRKKWICGILLVILPFLAVFGLNLAKNVYAKWVMPYVPMCPVRVLTGYLCPSCGLTHAVFALCRGDILEAAKQNAILLVGAALGIVWYAELWVRLFGGKKIIPRSGKFWLALLGIWMLYAVVRNLV